MLALSLSLLLSGHSGRPHAAAPEKPPMLVIVVDGGVPDAGKVPLDPEDRRLLDDLDLLRQWKLLEVYPLLAPQ